jgi:hypothetical protein
MDFQTLIVAKEEYTTKLVETLKPLIYEGFLSIYKHAWKVWTKSAAKADDKKAEMSCLQNFQIFVLKVKSWNDDMIGKEIQRIKITGQCGEWLELLIRAIIKINTIILSGDPDIDISFMDRFQLQKFMHQIYLECSRAFSSEPQLFWHEYHLLMVKENQRKIMQLIDDSIQQTIRKSIPLTSILSCFMKQRVVRTAPREPMGGGFGVQPSIIPKHVIVDDGPPTLEQMRSTSRRDSPSHEKETSKKSSSNHIDETPRKRTPVKSESSDMPPFLQSNKKRGFIPPPTSDDVNSADTAGLRKFFDGYTR